MAQQLSCREELIAPCSCRGTSKYGHPECLHTWRYLHPARASQCTTCGASFLIRLDPETSEMRKLNFQTKEDMTFTRTSLND